MVNLNTITRTAVPSRSRASSTPSPVMPMSTPSVSPVPTWRDRVVLGLTDGPIAGTHHNSIASVAEAGNAPAKDGFYAAKQAAPPRGVPR